MKISIIIATVNRAKQLARILPTYQNQMYIKEIIIIDDMSTDETQDVVKEFIKKDSRIIYIKNKKRLGTCRTKNKAIEKTTGDYIFFGEDDLELNDNFLKILLDHLKKNNADIIAGRRIWPHPNETKEQSYLRVNKKSGPHVNYDLLWTDCEINTFEDKNIYLLDASMLFTKKVAKSIVWDTKLFTDNVAWRSETDFQLSAAEQGYKLIYCPHVIAYHLPRYHIKVNFLNYLKYDFFAIKNNFLLSLKHKQFLHDKLNISNILIFNLNFILSRIKKRYL